MKARLGVQRDSQLAEKLGYSTAAIAQWKKRGEVPTTAQFRADLVEQEGRAALAIKRRKDELGKEALREGRCLAILLAPSLDAVSRRFPVSNFDNRVRQYADYFDEIVLACAEVIDRCRREASCSWQEARDALTLGETAGIYAEITQRANWWRNYTAT